MELHSFVLKAGQEYKTLSKEKAIEATRKRTYAEDLREEVHVFKRRSTHDIQRQINDTKKMIEEARKQVADLESKQQTLESERDSFAASFVAGL